MTQELNQRRETLDNLDKVEPYGNSTAARAASNTANLYARTGQQFSRLLGKVAEKMALREARNLAFETDPETGVPILPEQSVRLGGMVANDVYQRAVDVRYENSLGVALKDKLADAERRFLDDEEGYRQEAAIIVGAMHDKVRPDFRQVFLDQATEMNTNTANQIAYRVAMSERAEARRAARSTASSTSKRHILANYPAEQREALLAQLREENSFMVENQPEEAEALINKLADDIIVEQVRNDRSAKVATDSPDQSNLDTEVEANNEVIRKHSTNFNLSKKSDVELAQKVDRLSQLPPDVLNVELNGMTPSARSKLFGKTIAGSDTPAFWLDETNYADGAFGPVQDKLMDNIRQGNLLPAQTDILSQTLGGNSDPAFLQSSLKMWQTFGGEVGRSGTWANKNPQKAGALDAAADLAFGGYRNFDSPEAFAEAINARLIQAATVDTEDLAKAAGVDEPKKATITDIRDSVRQAAYSSVYTFSDARMDPARVEDVVDRTVGYMRGTEAPDIEAYIGKVIDKEFISDPGYVDSNYQTVDGVFRVDYPQLKLSRGNPTQALREVASRALSLAGIAETDPNNSDELKMRPLRDGEAYEVMHNGFATGLVLETKDVQALITQTENFEYGMRTEEWKIYERQIVALEAEWNQINDSINNGNVTADQLERYGEIDEELTRIKSNRNENLDMGFFGASSDESTMFLRMLPDTEFERFLQ